MLEQNDATLGIQYCVRRDASTAARDTTVPLAVPRPASARSPEEARSQATRTRRLHKINLPGIA